VADRVLGGTGRGRHRRQPRGILVDIRHTGLILLIGNSDRSCRSRYDPPRRTAANERRPP
jgi:hypothetical protein